MFKAILEKSEQSLIYVKEFVIFDVKMWKIKWMCCGEFEVKCNGYWKSKSL